MAYNKTTWANGQTPINETNLNNMENGIAKIDQAISFKGYIGNNNDLNNVTETGIYSTGNGTLTHAPISNYNWAFLIVLNHNYVIQQYFIKPVSDICYIREYSGSPSSWKDWRIPNQDANWTNATLNSSIFSGGTVKYFKQGNVVTVNISDLKASSDISTHGTIIASGLPNAVQGTLFMLNRYKAPNSTSANCRVSVNTSGKKI